MIILDLNNFSLQFLMCATVCSERRYCGCHCKRHTTTRLLHFHKSWPLTPLILTGGTLLQGTGSLSANRIRAQLEVTGSQTHHVWNSIEPERSEVTLNHSQHRAKNQKAATATTQQRQGERSTEINAECSVCISLIRMWKLANYERCLFCGIWHKAWLKICSQINFLLYLIIFVLSFFYPPLMLLIKLAK